VILADAQWLKRRQLLKCVKQQAIVNLCGYMLFDLPDTQAGITSTSATEKMK
jgi:hypothetical protein